MAKFHVSYSGQLRTQSIHLKSQSNLITDAPTDNHGKGETFSPTDLTAISLVSCIITVIGIKASQMGLDSIKMEAEVDKVMTSDPRKIGEITADIRFTGIDLDEKTQQIFERTGNNCPVALSLHPDLKQSIQYIFD